MLNESCVIRDKDDVVQVSNVETIINQVQRSVDCRAFKLLWKRNWETSPEVSG